uniref:COesterase domain-containing protein n=1 Tax=Bursaphelenchus xylophilus TaxID=6326 RepID=A0A1I7S6N4_BURXY
MSKTAISILLLNGFVLFGLADQPRRQTQFGDIDGFYYTDPYTEKKAAIYLGVPFAEPPLGELRFEKTKSWSRKWTAPLNATDFPPGCVPMMLPPGQRYSEDCLKLNIMTPSEPSNDPAGYPVLVYVHGGAFGWGLAETYGYKNLTQNYVSKGLIVVVTQYRLGAMGFVTDGGEELPGNLGMFDQAETFKWIHYNIRSFGGNPDKVTAWGLSAGGGSVGLLELSPYSRDYIHNIIAMSGTPLCPWGVQPQKHVKKYSQEVAYALNCETGKWKECFKKTTTDEFLAATSKVTRPIPEVELLMFIPVYDNDFVPKHVYELVADTAHTKKINAIVGVTKLESLYFNIPKMNQSEFGKQDLIDYTHKTLTSPERLGDRWREVEERIVAFYTSDKESVTDPELREHYYLWKYMELTADIFFTLGALQYSDLRAANGLNTYLYHTEYFNPSQYPEDLKIKAATHANEYPYMNGDFPVGHFEFDDDDREHQRIIVDMITNMALTGKPHPDWAPLDNDRNNYANLGAKLELRNEEFAPEKWHFWNRLAKDYGRDIISLKEVRSNRDEL